MLTVPVTLNPLQYSNSSSNNSGHHQPSLLDRDGEYDQKLRLESLLHAQGHHHLLPHMQRGHGLQQLQHPRPQAHAPLLQQRQRAPFKYARGNPSALSVPFPSRTSVVGCDGCGGGGVASDSEDEERGIDSMQGCGIDGFFNSRQSTLGDAPSIHDAYQLRARDLTRLDPSERAKLTEEIHGLLTLFEETPESVEMKLQEFQAAVDRIPDKPAYNKARLMNADYVNRRELHLMALRADEFDVLKAARRYVNHYEFKLQLFGLDKLARTITFDDLEDDDKATLENGFYQFLPKKDSAGRLVIFMAQEHQKFKAQENLTRAIWYMGQRHFENDADAQRKGSHVIMYNLSMSKPSQLFREQMKHGDRFMKSSLNRLSALHYCYDNPKLQPAMAVFQIVLGRAIRLRFCPHFGSHIEIRYKLAPYGIPIDEIPVDVNGQLIADGFHKRMAAMAEAEREELQEEFRRNPNRIAVNSRDVLFGRGRGKLDFPGNKALSNLVAQNYDLYNHSSKTEKTKLATEIVRHINDTGRFLMQEDSSKWRVATDMEARKKVSHAFRNFRQKSVPPQSAASSVSTFADSDTSVSPDAMDVDT